MLDGKVKMGDGRIGTTWARLGCTIVTIALDTHVLCYVMSLFDNFTSIFIYVPLISSIVYINIHSLQ
jgi:hypothetical protein